MERFDALLGVDDIGELDRLCTPEMVNHALAPDRPAGLAGTREFLETQGRHQINGQYWDELVVVAEGDYVEPGSYVRDFAAMYRFEDGRIAER